MNLNSKDIHSIIFGDKNSWVDWFLIPSSRPVFKPPAPKYKFVDIPGGDGKLDLSTALTGDIAYDNREGSLEFIVDNDHIDWYILYSNILDYLHGKYITATLEDEPAFYYEGRFSVNDWKSDPDNSKIVIDYTVSPYKIENTSSLDDWEWDTFSFETGIIREYKNLKVGTNLLNPSTLGNGKLVEYNGVQCYEYKDGSVDADNGFSIHSCFKKNTQYTFTCKQYRKNDSANKIWSIFIEYTDGTRDNSKPIYSGQSCTLTSKKGKTVKRICSTYYLGQTIYLDLSASCLCEGTVALPCEPYIATREFIVYGRRMSVSPTFIVDSTDNKGMKVTFNGATYNLPEGSSRVVNIRTVEGENVFKFTGNGTVSIGYRGGCL